MLKTANSPATVLRWQCKSREFSIYS